MSKADLRFFELTSPLLAVVVVVDSPNAAIALAAAADADVER